MDLHDLYFASIGDLMRSFDELMRYGFVEDCVVDRAALRIRFRAPRGRCAPVLERIYLRGGLTWCSRHPLRLARDQNDGGGAAG